MKRLNIILESLGLLAIAYIAALGVGTIILYPLSLLAHWAMRP